MRIKDRQYYLLAQCLDSNYNGDLKSDHLKSRLFEGQISNGRALTMCIAIVPTITNQNI